MRIFLSLLFFVLLANLAHAQIAHDYMVGVSSDLIKTDNSGAFKKIQAGAEFNYFVHRRITVTTGFELWTADEISFVIGGRWFPTEDFFVRARGLVGTNEVSLGGGWVKPLNESFRFEATGDFYFKGEFAIRVGLHYVFRRNIKTLRAF